MVLTPEDVERQEFPRSWRGGYDRREVDRFLDRVGASLAHLARERDQQMRHAEELEREAGEALGAERLLKRALVEAQRAADETVAEARRSAAEILAEARRSAAEILAEARQEAEVQRERARVQSAGVRQAVGDLRRFRSEYGHRVRAVIERISALPPLPDGLDEVVERMDAVAPSGGGDEGDAPGADSPPPGAAGADGRTDVHDGDPGRGGTAGGPWGPGRG